MNNRLHLNFFIFAVFSILLSTGCEKSEPAQLKIALSKGYPEASYASYYSWIDSLDSTAECVELYNMPADSALELFRTCSGLLLTGGTDIDPAYYGKAYDTVRCWPIDHKLDSLEIRLIDSALAWNKPILGICRGHQVINVALGGSLIVDIPQDFGTTLPHQCGDVHACFHTVNLNDGSVLKEIAGDIPSGETNSNHHQAVDQVAPGLRVAAVSTDGLIESVEWKDPDGKPFLLGIQWHPERLDLSSPLSGNIGRKFLEECR